MIEKITKYKKYIISIVLILLLSLFFLNLKYLLPKKYKEIPEVRLKEIVNKEKAFAVMIQKDDGYEEYKSEDNPWPGSNYIFSKAECIDNSGNRIEGAVTFEKETVILETDQTVYCTLYFDEKSKVEITNATKICDMGTSMSIEFTTSGSVGEYYYSTNGKDFIKGRENLYSIQKLVAGENQKIYVYVIDSDGKRSETKEYDFTTKTLGNKMTASELKASKPKDLNLNDIKTQGGMYRYQAAPADETEAAQMTNWIMFGAECTNKYAKLNEEEKIDKYMYRIIGITEEGELYLLKETFLKEKEIVGFAWHNGFLLPGCIGEACEWLNADLYKRLNGETSNGNPIFVDSSEYEYMAKGTKWYNLIEEHNWMYGDTNEWIYNGNTMYGIETGNQTTKRIWPDEGQTTCSSSLPCTAKGYTWSKSVNAKIGLLYIHDYMYAYPEGNPNNNTNVANSWIHFQKDGYNSSPIYEWLITRFGVTYADRTNVVARIVTYDGALGADNLNNVNGVRLTFYLSSKAKIVDGNGTKLNPYILE